MTPDNKEYKHPEWLVLKLNSTIAKKITQLRERIEWWSHKNGYENMDNEAETRNKDGEIIWKRTDREYVDDTYNHYINDKDYIPRPATLIKMNELWIKYKL